MRSGLVIGLGVLAVGMVQVSGGLTGLGGWFTLIGLVIILSSMLLLIIQRRKERAARASTPHKNTS